MNVTPEVLNMSVNSIFERVLASALKDNRKIDLLMKKNEPVKKVGRPVGRPRVVKQEEPKGGFPLLQEEEEVATFTKNPEAPLQSVNKKIVENASIEGVKNKRRSSNKGLPENVIKAGVKNTPNSMNVMRDLSVFPEAENEPVDTKMGKFW